MRPLEGVLESSLYVTDLDRAVRFYQEVLGLRLMEPFDHQRGVAFQVGSSVLLLFRAAETLKPGELPAHGASGAGHLAFRVEPGDRLAWRERLVQQGVAIEREHSFGNQPPSIYFRDPDGNVLELAVASIWPFQ